MAEYPNHLQYTKEHEWADHQASTVRVGITPYAVKQLGDVTLVDLPAVGTEVQVGERFGDIESVKTVSELFAPVSGRIVEINADLEDQPELVNEGPFEQGWMVVIEVSDGAVPAMMDAAEYETFIAGLD